MSSPFDVIVLGVGGMGSSACYHLAKRGLKVLGLERFTIGHSKGSSHGDTRLIRRAYFEEARYVPLLNESYKLWKQLEDSAEVELLHQNGLILFSPAEGGIAKTGMLNAAKQYDIPLEVLTETDCLKRFPYFRPPAGSTGIFEPGAGFLEVDECVTTYAAEASGLGATFVVNSPVKSWKHQNSEFHVSTDSETFRSKNLVITSGAWTTPLLRELSLPLTVQRIPQCWFAANEKMEGVPCFAFDTEDGFFYGFPKRENYGVKVADYKPAGTSISHPELADEEVSDGEISLVQSSIRSYLPEVETVTTKRTICFYTMTPDEHFLLDAHPEYPGCYFAAGFSGHGFKFSSFVGNWLADKVTHTPPSCNTDFLSLRRFWH